MKTTSSTSHNIPKISLHPNPTSDYFQIKGVDDEALVTISDINCRVLLIKRIVGDENISIDTFRKGVYIAKITTDTCTIERKLVKC